MKMTIESTNRIVELRRRPADEPVLCRVWEGKTEQGIDVVCLIPQLASPGTQPQQEFLKDLQEHRPPTKMTAICCLLAVLLCVLLRGACR